MYRLCLDLLLRLPSSPFLLSVVSCVVFPFFSRQLEVDDGRGNRCQFSEAAWTTHYSDRVRVRARSAVANVTRRSASNENKN